MPYTYIHSKKKTHFYAQSVASNFTPNLYPKHLLSQTTYICLKYNQNFFYCFLHIYSYWQAIYIMHTLAFKREFRAIIHSFRKTIIHTLLGISCSLYLPMYTHYCKVFSTLPLCKVSNMGQPKFEQKLSQAGPNFHAFLILKPNFGFLVMSMFSCIEA